MCLCLYQIIIHITSLILIDKTGCNWSGCLVYCPSYCWYILYKLVIQMVWHLHRQANMQQQQQQQPVPSAVRLLGLLSSRSTVNEAPSPDAHLHTKARLLPPRPPTSRQHQGEMLFGTCLFVFVSFLHVLLARYWLLVVFCMPLIDFR